MPGRRKNVGDYCGEWNTDEEAETSGEEDLMWTDCEQETDEIDAKLTEAVHEQETHEDDAEQELAYPTANNLEKMQNKNSQRLTANSTRMQSWMNVRVHTGCTSCYGCSLSTSRLRTVSGQAWTASSKKRGVL